MISRTEYPKPQFERKEWINLNGDWDFYIDYGKSGKNRRFFDDTSLFDKKINVPFCPESKLSNIGITDFMECVWYSKETSIPDSWKSGRTILHFGACDYLTEVWVDGNYIGKHIGGYTSFSFDITDYALGDSFKIVVCATDDTRSNSQPSGKQSSVYQSQRCSYTRSTGIWQTVWLEYVPNTYIKNVKMTPVIESESLIIEAKCENANGIPLKASVYFNNTKITHSQSVVYGNLATMIIKIDDAKLWTPEEPNLYNIEFSLGDDAVHSYFGMRSISTVDGIVYINNKPIFQRLVLDQGYYPDGIYTAKDEEELVRDIKISMDMGFNGARLHQKIYEERFLYHCDRLGYIVWGEFPNWGLNISRDDAWRGCIPEWLEELERDYNHPSIIGWCPFNESDSTEKSAELIKMVVDLTHAYDKMRPVIEISGFVHVPGLADILDTHDYEKNVEIFKKKYDNLANNIPVQMPRGGLGLPTFNSEYGSLWCAIDNSMMWHPEMMTIEKALYLYKELTTTMLNCKRMGGYCFTQLVDVEQEMNGLYTYNRDPKIDPKLIYEINKQKAAIEN
ncbi:MAG: beta-galactosidase [Clostridia bacterium]|nr:beta-galactosidase [Clostridia bacterium]